MPEKTPDPFAVSQNKIRHMEHVKERLTNILREFVEREVIYDEHFDTDAGAVISDEFVLWFMAITGLEDATDETLSRVNDVLNKEFRSAEELREGYEPLGVSCADVVPEIISILTNEGIIKPLQAESIPMKDLQRALDPSYRTPMERARAMREQHERAEHIYQETSYARFHSVVVHILDKLAEYIKEHGIEGIEYDPGIREQLFLPMRIQFKIEHEYESTNPTYSFKEIMSDTSVVGEKSDEIERIRNRMVPQIANIVLDAILTRTIPDNQPHLQRTAHTIRAELLPYARGVVRALIFPRLI